MLSERVDAPRVRQLAEQGASRQFRLDESGLPRLAVLLARDGRADLDVQLNFASSAEGVPSVAVHVTGWLALECQRCLDTLRSPVDVEATLLVVPDEAAAEAVADPFDTVLLTDGVLDLAQMVEDEILASLPVAPVHGPGEACAAPGGVRPQASARERRQRPFANLAAMMGRDGNGANG